MSNEPKEVSSNEAFQNITNTSNQQNDKAVSSEQQEKEGKSPSNPNDINQANDPTKSAVNSLSIEYYDESNMNLLQKEKKYYRNNNYFPMQKELNKNMRAILVNWLTAVHFLLNMKEETLFTCISIIDAYLSKKFIKRKDFQLLGITALLIACKKFETIFPSNQAFIQLTAFAYTVEELEEMEVKVMFEFNFDNLSPTVEDFFAINSEYFLFDKKQNFVGEYFLNISLLGYDMLKYKPSTIAVACAYLVIKYFNLNGKDLILDNTSEDVSPEEVKKCARELCHLMNNASTNNFLNAAKNKFMSDKYMNVAELL